MPGILEVLDRVFETSVTVGTGTYTLDGAQAGHQAYSNLTANNYTTYLATDDVNWEMGIGTRLAGPNRLTRDTILGSSNAGAAVNWGAGTRKIYLSVPAAGIMQQRRLSKSVAGGVTVVLTADEQRRPVLEFNGALTANIAVEVDATPWVWPVVYNNTTGAYTLTFKVTGQTGVVVPQKRRVSAYCDGTDVFAVGQGPRFESRAANTMLGVLDFGKTLALSGTFTQTFAAAATLGEGWHVLIRNDSTGVITLDPNGAETINGAATLALYPGESCIVECDGSALKTIGLPAPNLKIGKFTYDLSTASGTLAITGVGFKPRAVLFIAGKTGSGELAIGFDGGGDAGSGYGLGTLTGGGGYYFNGDGTSILFRTAAPDYITAAISALGADGFTLNITKNGSPTGTLSVTYIALR